MQVLSMEITKTVLFRTSLMILNLSADRDERLVNQQRQFGQASRNGKELEATLKLETTSGE